MKYLYEANGLNILLLPEQTKLFNFVVLGIVPKHILTICKYEKNTCNYHICPVIIYDGVSPVATS